MLEPGCIIAQHIVDKSKIHVFVHISFFEHVAGDAGGKEKVRLEIDAISSVCFGFD